MARKAKMIFTGLLLVVFLYLSSRFIEPEIFDWGWFLSLTAPIALWRILLSKPVFSLVPAVLFGGLFMHGRRKLSLASATLWLFYAVYEYTRQYVVVDLFPTRFDIYPIALFLLSLSVVSLVDYLFNRKGYAIKRAFKEQKDKYQTSRSQDISLHYSRGSKQTVKAVVYAVIASVLYFTFLMDVSSWNISFVAPLGLLVLFMVLSSLSHGWQAWRRGEPKVFWGIIFGVIPSIIVTLHTVYLLRPLFSS